MQALRNTGGKVVEKAAQLVATAAVHMEAPTAVPALATRAVKEAVLMHRPAQRTTTARASDLCNRIKREANYEKTNGMSGTRRSALSRQGSAAQPASQPLSEKEEAAWAARTQNVIRQRFMPLPVSAGGGRCMNQLVASYCCPRGPCTSVESEAQS